MDPQSGSRRDAFPRVYERILRHTGTDPRRDERLRGELMDLERLSGGDPNLLSCMIKRWIAGDPLPYISGELEFGGRSFAVDKRVYLTDPEALHLVELLAGTLKGGEHREVLEVGTGCGSLAISLKIMRPECRITAVDVDAQALEVARMNAGRHGVEVRFVLSDYLMGLPEDYRPEVVFADPPWGTRESLYEDRRSAEWYDAMPGISVWPFQNITGIHRQIIGEVGERGWNCDLYLNFGMLEKEEIFNALADAPGYRLFEPQPNVTLARVRFGQATRT